VRIKPTDADYQIALHKFTLLNWQTVKDKAIQCAAERLLEANMAEQNRLIAKSQTMAPSQTMQDHLAWRKNQDRITELFAEHDRLLGIAYPRTKDPDE
jgi:hypothetical protein